MKRIISVILCLALVLGMSMSVFAIASSEITALTVTEVSSSSVSFSGTTDGVAAAVVAQVLDKSGNILNMQSFVISENAFAGTIEAAMIEGTAYDLRAADYDGGDWKTVEFTVPTTTPDPVIPPTSAAAETEEKAERHPFKDVEEGIWYDEAVQYMYDNKLIFGVTETEFDPDANITRQQMWAILARKGGVEAADYEAAKKWAVENGISDGTRGEDKITRQELMTLLYNYEKKFGNGGFTGSWMFLLDYSDRADVAEWADEAAHWCTMKKIVGGYPDGTLKPMGTATRAEAAVMLMNFCKLYEEK